MSENERLTTPDSNPAHGVGSTRRNVLFAAAAVAAAAAAAGRASGNADTSLTESRAVEEIQALHKRWFAATVDKDIDGLMKEIAHDIVSYEHEIPLQYTGVDNVRKVCLNGLESAPGTVTWTVPDMKVTTSGDLAVVWGLNQMTHEAADGQVSRSWSRGTRVFQRRDGQWLLVHQHVSFPYNRDTGAAVTNLTP